eukprot:4515023-Alexandrium_andersonii.AAC.1
MSASLVGSEMCIRDRPCRGRSSIAPSGRATTAVSRCSGPGGVSVTARGCLLYTSDAADDM